MAEQNPQISEAIQRERARLRNFIRRRVPDPRGAEDVLQDVFYKLVEANRLLMPIDHKRRTASVGTEVVNENDKLQRFEDLMPSPDAGPEALNVHG